MLKIFSVIKKLIPAVLLLCPLLASAQNPPAIKGWYAGGGVGYSNVRAVDSDDWFSDTNYGDADFAYAITGGYRFMRYLALELSYVDSGKPDYDDNSVDLRKLGGIYDVDAELDIDSTQIALLGILPLADGAVELFVKAGAAFWDAESEQYLRNRGAGPDIRRTVDENDVDFMFGFGAALNFNKHWHARVDFSSHAIDDDLLALESDYDASVENMTVQLHYRFGDNW
jgi:opacity protein-like surface antigen